MLKIDSIEPGSYAAEMGLQDGDLLLSINDQEINDIIDYHLAIEAETLQLEVLHEDEIWELELEKEPEEDLGLAVEHPQPHQCGNQCLFCFVHQLPKGMRRTLYVKDEDYRFSYLYGSYITLTNLSDADMERIITRHLSPLYISVHAVDHPVREYLLGANVPDISELILRLTASGIELHCQVVLCPGINDGAVLDRTIDFLAGLMPQVKSLAVVPVGLTAHRKHLPALEKVTPEAASRCLEQIHQYQQKFLAEKGQRFVFPADEFYLLAGEEFPPASAYEEFPQIENGVGLIARFRQQGVEVLLEAEALEPGVVTLVSGRSFASELQTFAERLTLRTGVKLNVVAVDNDFFGSDITVAGLITGRDLITQLQGQELGDALLLPEVVLRDGEEVFLDDLSVADLRRELGLPVVVIESSPWGILEGLESLTGDDRIEIVHC